MNESDDLCNAFYLRVVPRDFFNEANLLKCYGQLALLTIDDNSDFQFEYQRRWPFIAAQYPGDGSLTIKDITFTYKETVILLRRPLNARDPWPLVTVNEDCVEIEIFDDKGNLSEEFTAYLKTLDLKD